MRGFGTALTPCAVPSILDHQSSCVLQQIVSTIGPVHPISVKLPAALHAVLAREARRRHVTRSTLVREVIEQAYGGSGVAAQSCTELAGSLVGAARSGRTDLATSRQLLEEAVLLDAQRATADRRR